MKILIVDDSKAMRMIVKRTLRQAGLGGHEVEEAGNGVEALPLVASWQPDLVLSDWNMPEMNGIDFLRALRAQGNEVRFGFVTAFISVDETRLVRLASVVPPGETSPEVDDVMGRAMARARFTVQVAGYPSGWVQLAAA